MFSYILSYVNTEYNDLIFNFLFIWIIISSKKFKIRFKKNKLYFYNYFCYNSWIFFYFTYEFLIELNYFLLSRK